jgi:hypothetical protein
MVAVNFLNSFGIIGAIVGFLAAVLPHGNTIDDALDDMKSVRWMTRKRHHTEWREVFRWSLVFWPMLGYIVGSALYLGGAFQ